MYKDPDIVGEVKSRRLKWAGHVIRKGENTMPQEVWCGKPVGKGLVGRPRSK